jgi:hypothetical protein
MIILPVIIGINAMEHVDNKFSNQVFKGRYTDFNDKWYADVGYQLTITVIIFSFQPMIDVLVENLILRATRNHKRKNIYNEE